MKEELEVLDSYKKAMAVNEKLLWLRGATGIGAIVTVAWAVCRSYIGGGLLVTLIGVIFLLLVYKIGVSPLFAVASSVLCFYFRVVGIWLPLLSYLLALVLLYLDLRIDNLSRKVAALSQVGDSEADPQR